MPQQFQQVQDRFKPKKPITEEDILKAGKKPGVPGLNLTYSPEELTTDPALRRWITDTQPFLDRYVSLRNQGASAETASMAKSITQARIATPGTIENAMNVALKDLRGPARAIAKSYLWSTMVHKDTGEKISSVEPDANAADFRVDPKELEAIQEMIRKQDVTPALETLSRFQYDRFTKSRSKEVSDLEKTTDPTFRGTMAVYDGMRMYDPNLTAEEIAKDPKRMRFEQTAKTYLRNLRTDAEKDLGLVIDPETGRPDKARSIQRLAKDVVKYKRFTTEQWGSSQLSKDAQYMLDHDPALKKKAEKQYTDAIAEYNRRMRKAGVEVDRLKNGSVSPYSVAAGAYGIDFSELSKAQKYANDPPEKHRPLKREEVEMPPSSQITGGGGEPKFSNNSQLAVHLGDKNHIPLLDFMKDQYTLDDKKVEEWVQKATINAGGNIDAIRAKVEETVGEFNSRRKPAPYEVTTMNGRKDFKTVQKLLTNVLGLPDTQNDERYGAMDVIFGSVGHLIPQDSKFAKPDPLTGAPVRPYEGKIDLPTQVTRQDLIDAGVDPTSAVGAIIRDNPAIDSDILGHVGTAFQALSGAINPFSTAVRLAGQAQEDMSESRKAFLAAGDAIFQIALGGVMAGATEPLAWKNIGSIAGKVLLSDNALDVVDGIAQADNVGFNKSGEQAIESIISQFNPGTFFDPNATKDEKAVAAVTQIVSLLAGGLHFVNKIGAASSPGYKTPYFDAPMSQLRDQTARMPQAYKSEALRLYQETLAAMSEGITDPQELAGIQEVAYRLSHAAADAIGNSTGWSNNGLNQLRQAKFDAEAYKGETGPMAKLKEEYDRAAAQWGGQSGEQTDLAYERMKAVGITAPERPFNFDIPQVEEAPAETQVAETTQPEMQDVGTVEEALSKLKSGEPVTVNLDELPNELAKDLSDLAEAPGIGVVENEDGTWTFTYNEPTKVTEADVTDVPARDVPESIETVAKGGVKVKQLKMGAEYITSLDPDIIEVDPGVQYKEVTDKKSMTGEVLKDVDVFDVRQAGEILVWQRKDGSFVVIHGHHRLELAKRAKKFIVPGVGGDVEVPREVRAAILREEDGWDLKRVRQQGAIENLKAGTGNPFETVKVLHELGLGPEQLKERGVSLKGALARDVAGLLRLPEEALNNVGPGKLSEQAAAGIGSIRALDSSEALMGAVSEALDQGIGRTYSDGVRFGEIFAYNMVEGFGVGDQGTLIEVPKAKKASIKEQAGLWQSVENRIIREAREYKSGVGLKTLEGEKIDIAKRKELLDAMGGSAKAAEEKLAYLFERDAPIKERLKSLGDEVASGKKTLEDASAEFYPDVLEGIARPDKDLIAGRTGSEGGQAAPTAESGDGSGDGASPQQGVPPSDAGEDGLFGDDTPEPDRTFSQQRFVDDLFKGIPDEALDSNGIPTALPSTAVFESVLGNYDLAEADVTAIGNVLKSWRDSVKSDPARRARINDYQRSLGKVSPTSRWFHGSSQAVELGSTYDRPQAQNLYGPGLYLTDDQDIAAKYTKKGRGESPSLYEVTIPQDAKFLDLEVPLPESVHDAFTKVLPDGYESSDLDFSKPGKDVYEQVKEIWRDEGITTTDAEELFDSLQYNLQQAGYSGLAHEGGTLTNGKRHNVRILFGDVLDGRLAATMRLIPPTAGETNASKIEETATDDGDMQPQTVEGQGQVPTEESSQGVQPQAEGRVQEKVTTGKPKTIYHASATPGVSKVKIGGQRMVGEPDGVYFAETPEKAAQLAPSIRDKSKAHITEATPPRNPLRVKPLGLDARATEIAKEIATREGVRWSNPDDLFFNPEIQKEVSARLTKELKAEGYDGVIFEEPNFDTIYVKFEETNAVQEKPDQSVLRPGEVPEAEGRVQEEVRLADLIAGRIEDVDAEIVRLKSGFKNGKMPRGKQSGALNISHDDFTRATKIGALYAKKFALKSAEWTAAMIESLGDAVKPYLDSIKRILSEKEPEAALRDFLAQNEGASQRWLPPESTGLSNRVQASEFEKGILDSDPRTKGKSNAELVAIGQKIMSGENPVDPELLAASLVNDVDSTIENVSVILAGKERLFKLREQAEAALAEAIQGGDVDEIKSASLNRLLVKQKIDNYVSNVQKGVKGLWNSIGRLLNAESQIDYTDPGSVLQEAELNKGSELDEETTKKLTELTEENRQAAILAEKAGEVRKYVRDLIADALKNPAERLPGTKPVLKDGKIDYEAIKSLVKEQFPDIEEKDVARTIAGKIKKPRTIKDPQALIEWQKTQARARLDDYERQLRTGEFDEKVERKAADEELETLRWQARQAAARVRQAIADQMPKTVMRWIDDISRNIVLFNLQARVLDLTSNAVVLGNHLSTVKPLSSLYAKILFGETVGREMYSPGELLRAFAGESKDAPRAMAEAWAGTSEEAIQKFGRPYGWGTRSAGVSDAPFKPIFEKLAADDYALSWAERQSGDKAEVIANQQAVVRQLLEGGEGPLSLAETVQAQELMLNEYLRHTHNSDVMPATMARSLKNWADRFETSNKNNRMAREGADFVRFMANINGVRFSRVIFNVGLDFMRYNPAWAGAESVTRFLIGKGGEKGFDWAKKIPAQESRIITQTLAKGTVGIGLYYLGQAMYKFGNDEKKDGEFDNGFLKGEIVTTAGGSKFVKWTFMPHLHGGFDATQMPGPIKSVLAGMTKELLLDSSLEPDQRDDLWAKWLLSTSFSNPIVSGFGDIVDLINGEKDFAKYAGTKTAGNVVPGIIRQEAENIDQARTGVELRKAPKGADFGERFWSEWKKRLPSPPEDSFVSGMRRWTRESLIPNVRGVPEDKRAALGTDGFRFTDVDWVYAKVGELHLNTDHLGKMLDAVVGGKSPEDVQAKRDTLFDTAARMKKQYEIASDELKHDPLKVKIALRRMWPVGQMNRSAWETINKWLEAADIPKEDWSKVKQETQKAMEKARAATKDMP